MIEDPRGSLRASKRRVGPAARQESMEASWIAPHEFYKASPDAERRLHAFLGMPWPCPEHAACAPIIEQMNREFGFGEEFATKATTEISRLRFFDADVTISRVAWCVARHLAAARIVETGVARCNFTVPAGGYQT